ncbi:hypothetical protein RUM43_002100 [Polyplax serrata]|uniref:Glutaredoxin-2, mitochondrial n=1 Tax=Polyplax serrata TaxID=468196 RepID=A0AAN8PC42_POLSC
MGIGVQSKSITAEDLEPATRVINDLITRDEIVIFSKTYCPYCKMAKEIFDNLNRKYTVIELDKREDGSAIQTVLGQMTGVRTVPRVFLNGRCIGGGNDIKSLYESGRLMDMLN